MSKKEKTMVYAEQMQTPAGLMLMAATDYGLCLLEFTDSERQSKQVSDLERNYNATVLFEKNRHIQQAKTELEEYFSKKRKTFTVRFDFLGTDFQKKVWDVLLKIPYGETWTYQEQANFLNHPKAVRAVANANSKNKISIMIPCHRVIGKNGKLTGYAGGLPRKKMLLDLEHEL